MGVGCPGFPLNIGIYSHFQPILDVIQPKGPEAYVNVRNVHRVGLCIFRVEAFTQSFAAAK
jgi:hypothetical protein